MLDTMESYASIRRNGVPITSRRQTETPEIDITTLERKYDHECAYGGKCLECSLPSCIFDGGKDRPLGTPYNTERARQNEERRQCILRDWQSGMTKAEIGEKYKYHPRTVRDIIRRLTQGNT